jgi:NitT/TauT family transport system substrate-binding protein
LSVGLDWRAQAALGGFFQAWAAGLYERLGLDVRLVPGGPSVDNLAALRSGRVEFAVVSTPFDALGARDQGPPIVCVAACFQKNPQILMAHAGAGVDSLKDLSGRTVRLARVSQNSWWPWLVKRNDLTDVAVGEYSYALERFLSDPSMVQQGYLMDQPYLARKAGVTPTCILLADHGMPPYSTLIGTSQTMIERNPDLVRRFTLATMQGWRDYLHGDRVEADRLILAGNRDTSPEHIQYSIDVMKRYGIVETEATRRDGIGVMTEEVWATFHQDMVAAGVYARDLDWRRVVSFDFCRTAVTS